MNIVQSVLTLIFDVYIISFNIEFFFFMIVFWIPIKFKRVNCIKINIFFILKHNKKIIYFLLISPKNNENDNFEKHIVLKILIYHN